MVTNKECLEEGEVDGHLNEETQIFTILNFPFAINE